MPDLRCSFWDDKSRLSALGHSWGYKRESILYVTCEPILAGIGATHMKACESATTRSRQRATAQV